MGDLRVFPAIEVEGPRRFGLGIGGAGFKQQQAREGPMGLEPVGARGDGKPEMAFGGGAIAPQRVERCEVVPGVKRIVGDLSGARRGGLGLCIA